MRRWHQLVIFVGLMALGGVGGCVPKLAATPTALTPVSVESTQTQPVPSPTSAFTATPLPSATVVLSANPPPTFTSTVAEPSPTPAHTPYPTLAAKGPYLVYAKPSDNQQTLVIVGADGLGRKEIELPGDDYLFGLGKRISPNDEWLAYYSGTADRPDSTRGPNNLSLNLLRLKDGLTQTVTALLSPDYPQNFDINAVALSKIDPKQFPADEHLHLAASLWDAFSNGIHSLAWSPDSRSLAFAGEMDGPSSDLYVYDVKTYATKRLTDGLGEIQQISWSPDGKWILNSSAYWVGEGSPTDLYAAAADDSRVKPVGGGEFFAGWLSPSEMLRYSSANGVGNFGLQKVDIETGQIVDWWKPPFGPYAYDQTHNLLAVWCWGDSDTAAGLYLVNLSTDRLTSLASKIGAISGLTDPVNLFVATSSVDATTQLIRADGTTMQVSDSFKSMAVSPDGRSIALYEPGLAFYLSNGKLVRSAVVQPLGRPQAVWSPDSKGLVLSGEPGLVYVPVAEGDPITISRVITASNISWRPDSGGLFFTSEADLYYWGLGDAQPILVDQHVPKDYQFQSVWLDSLGPAPSP